MIHQNWIFSLWEMGKSPLYSHVFVTKFQLACYAAVNIQFLKLFQLSGYNFFPLHCIFPLHLQTTALSKRSPFTQIHRSDFFCLQESGKQSRFLQSFKTRFSVRNSHCSYHLQDHITLTSESVSKHWYSNVISPFILARRHNSNSRHLPLRYHGAWLFMSSPNLLQSGNVRDSCRWQ